MADLNEFLAQVTARRPIPGVSAATLRAGARGPEYHFGIRGAHDQSSVDAHTVFEAASLTKPLVAFIGLQLIEEGLLDLHRPLFDICGDYVPGDLRSRHNAFSRSDAHERSSQYRPRWNTALDVLSPWRALQLREQCIRMRVVCELGARLAHTVLPALFLANIPPFGGSELGACEVMRRAPAR